MLYLELPPVEEVEDGPYLLKEVSSPVMRGALLKVLVGITRTPLFAAIRGAIFRGNGIPQLLEQTAIPEHPTSKPSCPWSRSAAWDREVEPGTVLLPEGGGAGDAVARVTAAAEACGGSVGAASAPHHYPSIADYYDAYNSGRASPSQVAEAVIAAVRDSEARQPPMRAFIAFDEADIREQATVSTRRYASGTPLSCLDGVPYCLKDTIDAVPYQTTEGTAWVTGTRKVTQDAVLVSRLRACGAILLGKSNMHEIGLGTTGLNLLHGTPRNPHDPSRNTGGSSSGSAAAIAMGICPIALGTDGGGSIRIPAALCGLVGLKPTHGRVGVNDQDKPPFHSSVGVFGPMGCSVRDTCLMYSVLANNRARPSEDLPPLAIPRLPPVLPNDALKGKTVAVYWKWFEDVDPEVLPPLRAALDAMRAAGAEVVSCVIPELHLLQLSHTCTIASEHRASMAGPLTDPSLPGRINPDVRLGLAIAQGYSSTMYVQAQRVRTRVDAHFGRVLAKADFIATPALPCCAPPINAKALTGGESNLPLTVRLMRFTLGPNFDGRPAIAVPVGVGERSSMPVSLQLIGRHWSEASLLHAAAVVEERVKGSLPRPTVHYSPLRDAIFEVEAARKSS